MDKSPKFLRSNPKNGGGIFHSGKRTTERGKRATETRASCNSPPLCYNGPERWEAMKITLNQNPSCGETEIIINCPQADEDILRLVAMLRVYQKKQIGRASCRERV